MLVKDIYENALALNIATMDDEEKMDFFALKFFNLLLYETKANNNCIRRKKGLDLLTEVPVVKDMEDEMPYEKELYAPFSYGLAAKLLTAQEETTLGMFYQNQYINLLQMVTPYTELEVG